MICLLNESVIAKAEKKIYDFLPHEPETMTVTLFIIGMAAYYLWRMFAITPQYNELYSYVMFISNGPLYSALHWPLENNHVGYSVLSALLYYLGNSYVALRGVSYICAISNLVLVYRICKKYYSHGLPLVAMVLYASMQVVNDYSVQGRGYTLATFCFLLSFYVVGDICRSGDDYKLRYATFIICCVYGMYTIPSSVNWVVPMCISAILFLFINGFRSRSVYASDADNVYFKKLNKVFGAIGLIVFLTLVLYTVLWLSIGSTELIEDAESLYYGDTNGTVLIRNPVKALGTGFSYMMDHRTVNNVEADLFKSEFLLWIKDFFDYMLPGMWIVVAGFLAVGIIIMIYECIRHFEYSRTSLNLIVIINIIYVVAVLFSTHNLPNLRGFGYGSFLETLCVCSLLEKIINALIRFYNRDSASVHKENESVKSANHWYDGLFIYLPVLLVFILFFFRIRSEDFSAQLGDRENTVFDTMYIANIPRRRNPAVLDCDQDYLLLFEWGIKCNKYDVTDSDCVILDRKMAIPRYDGKDAWKFYQDYYSIDWEYLDTMHIEYENDNFILYTK